MGFQPAVLGLTCDVEIQTEKQNGSEYVELGVIVYYNDR